MRRNLPQLATGRYDVCIVGGGIYGVCAAWDAALRGLSVALVDQGDFGHATSSNTMRLIHGGLRYLQHLDIRRMRSAVRERTIWMRIAPHLAHPLPVLVPTYRHGTRGREAFSIALMMNDLIGFDRNRLEDPEKHIPSGRLISKSEYLRILPGSAEEGLTGGAVWYDGQIHNSERLVLSILRSAADAGASVANYVRVTGFIGGPNRVTGIRATDVLRGEKFDIQAKIVVNTGGPWIDKVLSLQRGSRGPRRLRLVKAMNLVTQPLIPDYAVGLPMADRTATSNGAGSNGSRLLFITPWRNRSLIGTSQTQYLGDPDDLRVTEEEVQEFIDQVNSTFPAARLRPEDICFFHAGLVPMEGEGTGRSATLGRKYRIYDHSLDEGLEGLISVCSVKFTEARHVSEEVINLVFEKLGKKPARTLTTHTAVHGGAIERFGEFLAEEEAKKPQGLSSDITKHLICNYGARYPRLFEYFDEDAALRETVSHPSPVLRAEVVHGVREEMAQKLTDVVLRRTELGMSGDPGTECLATCAGIMAKELNWSEAKIHQEIHEARNAFALAQPHG